ncbi:MAG TPA: mechanosensitive ion channel protein MscS [Rhodospirillaceae bacterium]|nr:mechanosensitive ion channel protein MscS [Rhodospirillaceae bacterium]MAX62641.1 mechanosensitive ion channel protein MscS [Rhodospirillaceae bacterium]MBB57041.1 mechanosensitive ion channel protein MscS [Rhodospirillaceae bacterium]HAJ21624.1 mechanosensitive ion channel protein MscS [Rhodospirillaceae bacterium]
MTDYWALVKDVWTYGIGGTSLGDILIALGILLVFLIFRQFFSRFILRRVAKIVASSSNKLDDTLATALSEPVRFIPAVIGIFFATEYLDLSGTPQVMATSLNRSLIVFVVFWTLYRMVDPLSFLLGKIERVFTSAMVDWLIKAIKLLVALIGIATILEIWGIQVAPIIAGLGLFGVAVALGAQDLFKNLIAGILILVEKRFAIGEWIQVDGVVEGTVESIGFRSTFVRRFDKAPVFVPNAQLSDVAVTNFSRMTYRRIYWVIGVEYRTTTDQLRQIRDGIEDYITSNPDFVAADKATLFVRLDRFNDSSIDFMVYCFTKTTVWGEYLKVKEDLAYAVKAIVEDAGSGFAFPSRSLYLETVPGSSPELFSPPEQSAASSATEEQSTSREEDLSTESSLDGGSDRKKQPKPRKGDDGGDGT